MEPGKSTASDKHILLVVPGFPKDETDSQCLPVVQVFVEALARRVRKVSVVALHYPYHTKNYRWKGIEIYPLNGANNKWKRAFSLYPALRREVRKLQKLDAVDLIHAIWINDPGAFALRMASELKLPSVLTTPGQDVQPSNRFLPEIRKSKQTIYCLSQFQTTFLREAGFSKVEVIEWGTNAVPVQAERPYDFCCVSSLIPLKNVEYVLQLVAKTRTLNPGIKGKIVGGGPQHAMLQSLIRTLNLEDAVELLGERSHAEALATIAQSRVLLHAANYEGFGMVHIEALAAGCHVFSTPVGVAMDNPHLHRMHLDLEKDAHVLSNLLKTPQPQAVLYDIETTVDRYLEVYDSF